MSRSRTKTHKDVEFHIGVHGPARVFSVFNEAAGMAISRSASNGVPVEIDVVIFSASGARWWAGDEGTETYAEDPDASVYERIVVQAESLGRIP